MTAVGCRPEQREGPGFDCHSERSEESGFVFERLLPQILQAFGLQNDTRPGTFESGQNDKRIEAFPLNFMPGYR